MAIDFPNSPTLGQVFTSPGGLVYTWDGVKWAATGASQAALVANPNKLVNPFMEIDQANEGTLLTNAGTGLYIVDGTLLALNAAGTMTGQRSNDAPSGYPNSVICTQTVTASLAAGSYNFIRIGMLEGDDLADIGYGTTAAQTLSLAFWVKSSIAGTYGGSIQNNGSTRSYPFSFIISAANVWQLITLTIPGDTVAGWTLKGNAFAMGVHIAIALGSTYQGTAGTWQAGNLIGPTGMTNTIPTTLNATFQVGPRGLWVSPVAQPLLRTSIQAELARCQRYYEKSYDLGTAIGTVTNSGMANIQANGGLASSTFTLQRSEGFRVNKRATPTMTGYSPATGASAKFRDFQNSADINTAFTPSTTSALWQAITGTATAAYNVGAHWTADARL